MPALKPSVTPRWAETVAGAPAANIATPTAGEADTGFTNGQAVVSSSKLNYLLRTIFDWCLYLRDAVFTADAGSGLAGVSGTGDGASPGGAFTPGGGGAPARGALFLYPQLTPSAPVNGDIWVAPNIAGSLFAKLNGVISSFLDATASALASLSFIGNPGNTASTNYLAWGGASQAAVAANGSVRANGQTTHMAGFAGQLRGLIIKTGALGIGGPVVVTLMKNGVATALAATIIAGTASGAVVTATGAPVAVALGDILEVQIANGVGVTTSIGLSLITALLSAG